MQESDSFNIKLYDQSFLNSSLSTRGVFYDKRFSLQMKKNDPVSFSSKACSIPCLKEVQGVADIRHNVGVR